MIISISTKTIQATWLVLFVIMAFRYEAHAQRDSLAAYTQGRLLFETNCSPCHGIHQEMVGPMLASITKKRDTKWLLQFIKNSQAVIATGDSNAVFLYERYHHQVMPSFKALSDSAIKNILFYIETESLHPIENIYNNQYVLQNSNAEIIRGQQIFQLQCAACHYVNKESSYAPSLGSVTKRKPRAWLHAFIRNSQQVIQSGDKYAMQLFAAYENHMMVSMEFLQDEEIDNVLQYIEFASSSSTDKAGVNGANISKPLYAPTTILIDSNTNSQKRFFSTLFIIIALASAVVLSMLITKLFRYLNGGK